VDLGAVAIREAVARSGVDGASIDYVIMGQVLQAGAGQITARQASIAAGLPKEVPAITINKVCLSGLNAIALADQLIRAGEIEIAVAGGMESMTNAPYVVPSARFGARMGNTDLVDTMVHDGLWSTFTGQHMGESSDEVNTSSSSAARTRTRGRPARTSAPPRRGRPVGSTTRWSRSRCRSARATRSSCRRTRASAATPRRSRSPS
jgi:acetyl-CoA C-acetyltransferase